MKKHIIDIADENAVRPHDDLFPYEQDKATAREIINLLAAQNYSISEAARLLDFCRDSLQMSRMAPIWETQISRCEYDGPATADGDYPSGTIRRVPST